MKVGCFGSAVTVLLLSLFGATFGGEILGEQGYALGFFAGVFLALYLLRNREPKQPDSSGPQKSPELRVTDAAVVDFLRRAAADGVIGKSMKNSLLEYHRRGSVAPSPETSEPQQAEPVARPPAPAPPSPPATRPAPAIRPKARVRPAPTPGRGAVPAVSPRPKPRPPKEPSPLAIGLRRLGSSTGAMWKTFSADVAIHTMIYLGVLLLALVMFAFFGLGFYGEVVSGDQWRPWRPVVALAIPAVGFGVAALLRKRTGIPFTANAVGFLAALTVPIMLSSLFQDGAPWGPPDLDGPTRWLGYAAVGLVSAAIYLFAARQSTMYAYLVGPGIWTAAGALGLFLEDGIPLWRADGISSFAQFTSDGISWAQMALVLVAMAATVLAVRIRRTGPVAPRIVRSAIVCLPVVAGFGAAFAALEAENSTLGVAAVPTVLLLSSGAVAFAARGSEFAWQEAGPGLRAWIRAALTATGVTVVAAGWVATGLLGVEIPWIGAGLALYAAVLLVGGRRIVGEGELAIGGLRLVGAAGMVAAVFDPWAAVATWGSVALALAVTEPSEAWRRAWSRVMNVAETAPERAGVLAAVVAVALSGGVRLGWPDGAAWIVLAVALVMASARWLPARAGAVREVSSLAPFFAWAGAAIAGYRWLELGTLDRPGFGVYLIAVGLVVAVSAIDRLVRLPLVVAALVPGTALALRYYDFRGSIIDASVAALAGTGLLVAAAFVVSRPLAVEAAILAHLLLWGAPVVGSPSDSGLMIGLFAVAVTHLTAAVAVDRGWTKTSLAGPLSPMASALAHAVVGAVTLPAVAVLAARQLPWFAAERPRSALVMVAAAWTYSAAVTALRQEPLRRLMTLSSHVLGLLAVAVAVPSQAALLVTTWSAALGFAWHAVRVRSAMQSLPAWVLALAASMITAARLGASRADIHDPLFACGVVLIALGAAAHRRGDALRAWGLPPLSLGLLVMPAALAFVIADQTRVGLFAIAAAVVYAALIWVLRTGSFAPLVAGMAAVAYADLVPGRASPFDHPIMWLPLAVALFTVAALQPTRARSHWLAPVVPGLVVSWLAVLVLAGAIAIDIGDLDRVLLGAAGLVAASALRWRDIRVGYAALALVGFAGLAAGPGWLALALTFDAAMVGAHATWRSDGFARYALAPLAAVLGAGAFSALGVWRQWSVEEALVATAAGALVAGVVAMMLSSLPVSHRLVLWKGSAHGLAQVGVLAFAAIGFASLPFPDESGPAAAALAYEAALLGVLATVRRIPAGAWVSSAFGAAAFTALGIWRQWSVAEALSATAAVAVVAGSIALVVPWSRMGERLSMWQGPAYGFAQAGAVGFIGIGLDALPAPDRSGAIAAFLGFEAVMSGVVSTVRRLPQGTWVSAALAAAALWSATQWQILSPWEVIGAIGVVSALATGYAVTSTYLHGGTRAALWRYPALAGSQLGGVVIVAEAFQSFGPNTAWAVTALVLAAEAVLLALLAPRLPEEYRLRTASSVSACVAAIAGIGAIGDEGVVAGLLVALGVVGALMMVVGSQPASRLATWGEPSLVGGWVLAVAVPAMAAGATDSDLALVSVFVIGGAGIVLGAIVAARWRASYLGMMMWAAAVFVWLGDTEITDPNVVIAPVAGVVLGVLALERLRARLLGQPLSADLSYVLSFFEVAAMVTALATAGWYAYAGNSLGHLVLLLTEAAVLVAWALVTRVRRRLAVGALGLVAVVVYPIAQVVTSVFSRGLTGGTVLAIGAALALILIVVGSLLERSRVRVGQVVRRLGEALEEWS